MTCLINDNPLEYCHFEHKTSSGSLEHESCWQARKTVREEDSRSKSKLLIEFCLITYLFFFSLNLFFFVLILNFGFGVTIEFI